MTALDQRYDPAFPIDQLVEHPDNPRRGDEAAIEASMAAHGFFGAVLVQASTGRIIAGNHRTRVARRTGAETIPVLFVDVDDDQARRLLLADNRTNDLATYDDRELAALLEDLASSGTALIGTGFSDQDLTDLLDRLAPPAAPDGFPDADPDALAIDYRCPACGYEWSGQPAPGSEPSDQDVPTAAPAPAPA